MTPERVKPITREEAMWLTSKDPEWVRPAVLALLDERDFYKQQAHNLTEQRIACLREISDLKAQVATLNKSDNHNLETIEDAELRLHNAGFSVSDGLIEAVADAIDERDALKAHVRTLREALASALSLNSHINCVCGRGFSRLPAVIKSAARAALAATEVGE